MENFEERKRRRQATSRGEIQPPAGRDNRIVKQMFIEKNILCTKQ